MVQTGSRSSREAGGLRPKTSPLCKYAFRLFFGSFLVWLVSYGLRVRVYIIIKDYPPYRGLPAAAPAAPMLLPSSSCQAH